MKNILVIILLMIIAINANSQSAQSVSPDGIVSSKFNRSHQDIMITYDMNTGIERWYLKKVGAEEFSEYNYNKLINNYGPKIKCHRNIYLKLVNYNANRYETKTNFNNKEIEIAGNAKESFENIFNELNPATKIQSSPLDSTAAKSVAKTSESIQNGLSTFIESRGLQIDDNKTVTGKIQADITLNFLESKKKMNVEQLTNTLIDNLADTVSSTDSLLKLILEVTYSNQSELKKLSDAIEKSVNSFNTSWKHLGADLEKLNQRLIETAIRPNLDFIKTDAIAYINEYSGKPGETSYPLRADFLLLPGAMLKDMKSNVESIVSNAYTYDSIASTIVKVNNALQVIKGFVAAKKLDSIAREVATVAIQYDKTTQLISDANKKLGDIAQNAKNKMLEIQKTDWKAQFSNTFELFNKIIGNENSLTIHLGQADNDVSHLQVDFDEITLQDNKVTKDNLPLRKIEYDFRVFRGARLSFSPGLAFAFYGDDQKNYVKQQLSVEENPTQDSSKIVAENGNSFIPLFTNMVHVQWRSSNDIAPGLTLGLGVPLTGIKDIQYLLGGSVLFGTNERFIITAGAAGGKITKLGGGYTVNQEIPSSMEVPLVKEQYKIGIFLSVSVNLISAK